MRRVKDDSKVFVLKNWKGIGATNCEGNISCTAFGHFQFQVSISPLSDNTEKGIRCTSLEFGRGVGTELSMSQVSAIIQNVKP